MRARTTNATTAPTASNVTGKRCANVRYARTNSILYAARTVFRTVTCVNCNTKNANVKEAFKYFTKDFAVSITLREIFSQLSTPTWERKSANSSALLYFQNI